jgi:hypothetical protein
MRGSQNFIDLTGQVFGCLTVLQMTGRNKHKQARWLCRCDCGKDTTVSSEHLRSGHTASCGHLHQQALKIIHATNLGAGHPSFKHGHCVDARARARAGKPMRISEYDCWNNILQRYTNPLNRRFHQYGGLGIKVYDRWLNSFEAFLEDVGFRPSSKHSISRFLDMGNYEPGNVEWATDAEQKAEARGKRAMLAWRNRPQPDQPKPALIVIRVIDAKKEVA